MPQATRPRVESAKAVSTRPEIEYGREHPGVQPAAQLGLYVLHVRDLGRALRLRSRRLGEGEVMRVMVPTAP